MSGSAEAGTEFTANVAYYPYAESMVLSGDQGYEISNVALPPTNFEKGFTVTVTTVDGCVAELVAPENEVKRSGILVMPELAVNALIPVTLETEAGMTDVGLNVTIDHEAVTGFYGMFLMPGVWENVKLFEVSTNSFSYGANLALPEVTVEEVTYVKYEIFKVENGEVLPNTDWTTGEPIEFPTE